MYDYFSGREDLEARRVRFVGAPEQRIQVMGWTTQFTVCILLEVLDCTA